MAMFSEEMVPLIILPVCSTHDLNKNFDPHKLDRSLKNKKIKNKINKKIE
jgi:hypothetical protein